MPLSGSDSATRRGGLRPGRGRRWVAAALAVTLCAWITAPGRAEPVKVDRPVRVAAAKADKTRVVGRITSYDDAGFEVTDDKGKAQTVKWSDLSPKSVMEIYGQLLVKGTGEDWVAAGRVMGQLPDGKPYAERAYARALRMDPKLKAKIEEAKKAPPPPATAPAAAEAGGNAGGAGGAGAADETGGPVVGRDAVLKHLWGRLSDAENDAAVKELEEFARQTRKGRSGELQLLETKYFLFYSDLKPQEAQNWAGLLDRMYARLADLFGVEKGANIWRGKALVFVFSKPEDYHSFESESHQTDSARTAGMCHTYGNGYVHIAFYRQPNDLDFAHVLVHESVHGFIHRYRAPAHVPSWANEGLAEVIAYELVPQPGQLSERKASARSSLQQRGVGDGFFTTDHIDGWQYPIAQNLCAFMIQANRKGYVAFINGIKDGQTVDQSLEKNFGAPRDRLVAAFLQSMGVR